MTRGRIRAAVEGQGLIFLGVVSPDTTEDNFRFQRWLDDKKHAGMSFLERHPESRRHAHAVLAGAKSIVVVGLGYYQGDEFNQIGQSGPVAAQYARFADYHQVIKKRAEAAGRELFTRDSFRVVVDSAPLLERALASKTARGFIGKNTCFIHPQQGSFILLGEIVSSAALEFDDKVEVDPQQHLPQGGCGRCDRCQVRCPTGALDSAYHLDSNLCLAYWTIENRGPIPEKFWPWLRLYYFGCDICQLVCPYNKKEQTVRLSVDMKPRAYPPLFEIATMDQIQYEKWFGGTPMTRAKRNGLRRNALIAMTVTGDSKLIQALNHARGDNDSPIAETIAQIESYQRPGSAP